jgi:hypothetical protein
MGKDDMGTRPAGYSYLLDILILQGIPHWHSSRVSSGEIRKTISHNGAMDDIYPVRYWPGETIGDHLEFALKYDGTNLGLLAVIFENISETELTRYIRSKPTGKYARRIWFFYEFLAGKRLPIDDLRSGNYIKALEEKDYYTVENGEKSSRHRIVNNLLGPKSFCPVVRRTDKLSKQDTSDLRATCEGIITTYPPQLLRRALSYLYCKETKASFEIEHIKPSASRTEKFIATLELAEKDDFCEKKKLIELQNLIVDPRFRDFDYRTSQNYIGQTVAYQHEIIQYVSPRPEDLPGMMDGLIQAHQRMQTSGIPPVIHAAVIAYGFVFLHPFEDGNGRIHRFLIHNILSITGLVPKGLMFPVSAVMLKSPADYDASLEAFSRPLLRLVDYTLDDAGHMLVENETSCWYRYIDFTPQSEILNDFVTRTVKDELKHELGFLAKYDDTKKAIQNIIDMPDRLIDLFIQLCVQNNGRLSSRKRSAHFEFLSDDELSAMEQAVQERYERTDSSS